MGNKKSTIVITAVMEFLRTHPEVDCADTVINLQVNTPVSRETIESIVHSYIQKHFAHIQSDNNTNWPNDSFGEMDMTVSEMLCNLELFC